MRLINTHTLEFSEFYGSNIPKYAILSHTWGTEEVTYSEWLSQDRRCRAKEGYKKIESARKQAVEDGWDWLWVDTNCIDKSSSAELTEAINSMFEWYRRSEVCYAYLVDVPSHHSRRKFRQSLNSSRWFTRGWTLQELLAPRRLIFYSKEWVPEVERSDPEISEMISIATGIDKIYLKVTSTISSASVAQRMSWLARRQTTREEDIAYCMLGVFGINMPLLYGEGSRAFTRLQEEIIKTSHDHSLFCWTRTRNTPLDWDSILAPSPDVFQNSGEYIPKEREEGLTPYAMTNLGLSIQLPVIHTLTHPFVLLNAGLGRHSSGHRACLSMTYRSKTLFTPDRMLFRHRFPEGPVNLEPFNASLMPRHHFYISARPPALPGWKNGDVPHISSPNVLIVMQPTDSRLFRGFQYPENSGLEVSYVRPPYIKTYPPDMFDETRSILHLPPTERRPGQVNGCVISLSDYNDYGEIGQNYLLFFGCKNDHQSNWGCKIMSHPVLPRQEEMKHFLWDFLNSDFSDKSGRCSRISDGSLVLELGTPVSFGQDQSLQLATLRGPEQESVKADDGGEEVSDTDSNCAVAGG